MLVKKYLLLTGILNAVFISCSWASTQDNQELILSNSTNELIQTSEKKNTAPGTGKIVGKVINTDGLPLPDIIISIQPLTKESIYGSDFEDVDTTDNKGQFEISDLITGRYIVRATPPSDEFYLTNDKFNVKVRSNQTTKIALKLSAASHTDSKYAGSTVCLACHPNHIDWKKTAHAKTIQTPTAESVVAPFNGDVITTSDGKVKFKPYRENNLYKVTLYDLTNESVSVTYTIARTHGGIAKVGKQRYQVKIGNSHYILPIQYNNRNVDENNPNAAWVSYNPDTWYDSNNTLKVTDTNTPPDKSKSFEQNCEGCHVTGLRITRNANGEFISRSQELGISCERCHGPGELHVAEGGGKSRHIAIPEFLATDRGNEVCGQCHIRVKNKTGKGGANFETEYPCIINDDKLIPYIPGKVLKN